MMSDRHDWTVVPFVCWILIERMIDEGATPLKTRSPQITLNVTNYNGECIELLGAAPSEYTARTWGGDIQMPCKTVHIARDFNVHPHIRKHILSPQNLNTGIDPYIDLVIYSPIRLHGVVLNSLSTGTTLHFIDPVRCCGELCFRPLSFNSTSPHIFIAWCMGLSPISWSYVSTYLLHEEV
jgi:hypothetical protein